MKQKFLMDVKDEVMAGTKIMLFPVLVLETGMKRPGFEDGAGKDLGYWDAFEQLMDTEIIQCA